VIHPKTLLISRHFYSLESYVWKSIYNLNIETISMYDIPLDRPFLTLWNGIRHVVPSTERRLELKENIDGSERLAGVCVCQWVKANPIQFVTLENVKKALFLHKGPRYLFYISILNLYSVYCEEKHSNFARKFGNFRLKSHLPENVGVRSLFKTNYENNYYFFFSWRYNPH